MNDKNKGNKKGDSNKYIWTGLVFGIILGTAYDNLVLGIALGFIIGGLVKEYKEKNR